MKPIRSVLIANRSEVALRIQSSCNAIGLKTIAIYAPEDITSSFVTHAHAAYPLSGSGGAAYLNQEEIIDCARKAGADALHPGYGFLSENAQFARMVVDAGLTWVGPTPECIELMGNKTSAREHASAIGIPVITGISCSIESYNALAFARETAIKIGFPVILKDPGSGGGKGIRIVQSEHEFSTAWQRVTSEAIKQTGSRTIVIEKYLEQCRHIEVQIAGDGFEVIHLFDRDCSLQRKHQKIIEEAPAHFIDQTLRKQLFDAACTLARSVGYRSVGTVEFLVTPNNNFYFLEMNTRLQVEHSVTEYITNTDIVALQLFIAQYNRLPLTQSDIAERGHALECRICAEDPAHNFIPSTGTISSLNIPHGQFVRVDHDLTPGCIIGVGFDPMIAKITTWGMERAQAVKRMRNSLDRLYIEGIVTNRLFLKKILASERFTLGNVHTQLITSSAFIEQIEKNKTDSTAISNETIIALMLDILGNKQRPATSIKLPSRWRIKQWR